MAIQKCFSFVDVELETDIKICFVRVKITFFHALIRACYKPPNADAVFIQDLYKVMNFVTLRYPQCPIFLGEGDFNYPGINWMDCVPNSTCGNISQCRDFINLRKSCSLDQAVLVSTRELSILDMFLPSIPGQILSVNVVDAISDQRIVMIDADTYVHEKISENKLIFYYSRANSSAIASTLETFLLDIQVSFGLRSVEDNCILINAKFLETMDLFLPRIRITPNTYKPWFTKYLKAQLNTEKRLYSRARSPNSTDSWAKFSNHFTLY